MVDEKSASKPTFVDDRTADSWVGGDLNGPNPKMRPLAQIVAETEAKDRGFAGRAGYADADAVHVGEMVAAVRYASGMTQSQVAALADITQERLSDIERGKGVKGPSFSLVARILDACGQTLVVAPRGLFAERKPSQEADAEQGHRVLAEF